MTFLLFLFGIFLALGMFLLTADLLRLPRLATQRAMLSVGRQEKKQARSVEALLMGWAIKLAPHIHMDEYKRGRLKNTLAAAGLNMTPEEYTAFAILKNRADEIAMQFQSVLAKNNRQGIRTQAEKKEVASAWLELAISCAKVPVKYEADEIKRRQKEEKTQREAEPVMA